MHTDAPTNRKMLQRVLMNSFSTVQSDVAADGREAVEIVRVDLEKYRCIFMDNLMPEMVLVINRCHPF